MRPNWYEIISQAIEAGATLGYRRAHKHVENPPEELVVDAIESAIMEHLTYVIHFDEGIDE